MGLALFAFLTVVSIPVMLIVTLVKLSEIGQEIAELKRRLLPVDAPEPAHEDTCSTVEAEPARESASSTVEAEPAREVASITVESKPPVRPTAVYEPTAMDLFWAKVEDWFCVRGQFAPEGMSREFACATRWLVRIGVLLIVGSLVYFAKLSIDRGWMGPTGRVVATLLWGAAGAAGGAYLLKRTKYGPLGHAIAALGIVALYFGFGLGHRLFDPPVIASPGLAFAALFGVTVCAGVMSVVLGSSPIAVLGLVGGYLVPVIAGRDTGSPIGLDAYLLVLNLGAFAVARLRKWSALDFLASVLAMLFGFVWCGMHPALGHGALFVNFLFVTGVHLLYMASVVSGAKTRGKAGNALAWTGLALGAGAYFTWIVTFFRAGFANTVTGCVLLGVSAVYLSVAALVRQRGWGDRQTEGILLVFALLFLAIAPTFLLGAAWWSLAWSALAVALVEVGKRTGEKLFGILAYLVLCAAWLVGLFYEAPVSFERGWRLADGSAGPFLCAFLLRFVRLGALPAATAWIGLRKNLRELCLLAGIAVFVYYTAEASLFGEAFAPSLGFGSLTIAWTVAAFAGIWFGITRRLAPLRLTALALLGVSVVKLLLVDTARLPTPGRVGIFALVGVLLLVGAFLYLKYRERFEIHE